MRQMKMPPNPCHHHYTLTHKHKERHTERNEERERGREKGREREAGRGRELVGFFRERWIWGFFSS